jgi:hypothetical protein
LGKENKVLHHLQRLLQAGLADSWTKPILRLISNSRYPVFSFWFLSEKYLKGRLKNSFQTTFLIVDYQSNFRLEVSYLS